MTWLEKHINLFFKINGILMLFIAVFAIWVILWTFGIPNNGPSTWTPYQWNMIDFLWKPTVIYSVIYFLLAILCFMRKYFVFPAIVLVLGSCLNTSIGNISQIFQYGFVYPVYNIMGIFEILHFTLAIIGTILWIRKIRGKNKTIGTALSSID